MANAFAKLLSFTAVHTYMEIAEYIVKRKHIYIYYVRPELRIRVGIAVPGREREQDRFKGVWREQGGSTGKQGRVPMEYYGAA